MWLRVHALLGVPGVGPSGQSPHKWRRDSMRKRLTILAVLAVGAVAALAAGGSQAMTQRSAAKAPAAAGKTAATTVTLNGWVGAKVEDDLLKTVIKAFEKSHRSIKVNYDAFNNYQSTMLAKFSARRPPDVLYVAAEDFADWVRQGVLEPLDPFAKKTKFKAKPFYGGLLNSFKHKGRIYGYPKDWSSLAMEVNRGLLGGQPVPKTWGQLR